MEENNNNNKPKKFRISQADKEIDLLEWLINNYAVELSAKECTDEGFYISSPFRAELQDMIVYPKIQTYAERDEVFSELLKNEDDKYFEGKRYGFTQLILFLDKVSYNTARNKAQMYIKKQQHPEITLQSTNITAVEDLPWFFDQKGNLQKRYENLELILIKEGITIKLNEMTKKFEFTGIEHHLDVADVTFTVLRSICLDNNLKLSKDDMYSFVEVIAAKNRYNPIVEYLEKCKAQTDKNKISELPKLFSTIHFSTTDVEQIEFCKRMLLKWLLNCIKIAYNTTENQYTCEIVPTFQGDQGKGKSKWIRALVPKGFFQGDVILDLDNKDKIAEVLSNWIIELGELGGTFSKTHRDKIKGFITSYQDSWRSPYGRSTNTYPRRTAIFATVNDREFLVDKTGNRRFFVIPASSLDYQHNINIDKLWGELMYMYEKNQDPIYMTSEEQIQNDIFNKAYTTKTDTELALEDLFDWESKEWGACKLTDIEKYARDTLGRSYSTNAIKQVLFQHGCENYRMTAGKPGQRKQDRYWKVPFVEGVTLPF